MGKHWLVVDDVRFTKHVFSDKRKAMRFARGLEDYTFTCLEDDIKELQAEYEELGETIEDLKQLLKKKKVVE